MPAPSASWSTDHLLYTHIYDRVASYLCVIHPNIVTAACLMMVIPLVYGLHHGWSLPALLALTFVRQSLDCLDGAIARGCDTGSKAGAIFDVGEDMISLAILGGYVLWRLFPSYPPLFLILYACLFAWLLYLYGLHVYGAIQGQKPPFTTLEQWMHDNTMLLSLAGIATAHLLLKTG